VPNPTAEPQPQPSPRTEPRVSTPWQLPWPDGCVARYWTVAGATVDLTEHDRDEQGGGVYETRATCTGCPNSERFHWEHGKDKADDKAHAWAQSHASACRALPRPAAQ